MKYEAKVSSKNQVTLPAEIRKQLDIKPGMKIAFTVNNDTVTVESMKSILDFQGFFKAPQGKGIDFDREIDEAMAEAATDLARELATP